MIQATAVVLNRDKNERDDIRMRLAHCGVVPICFQDEWICLENIYHIKPRFAVLRTDSSAYALRFVNVAKAIRNNFPVVVLSKKVGAATATENNWLENVTYLRYPANDEEFQGAVGRLAMDGHPGPCASLIAGSEARKTLIKRLPRIAASGDSVLIQGEDGVGKRRLAREIHRRVSTDDAVFERIDGEQIATRWIRTKQQQLENAVDGEPFRQTIVIENIDRIPLVVQSQLLGLLDDPSANHHQAVRPHLRFISLARCDLASMARGGRLREDLYHRLSVLKIDMPPLRKHPSDIRTMAEYFAIQFGIHLKGVLCRLSDTVMNALLAYPWPGNVAELKRAISRLMTVDGDGIACGNHPFVDVVDIRRFLDHHQELSLKQARSQYVMRIEKKMLAAALEKTEGNCKRAAGLLNISYKSMLNKAKAYQLV